MSARIRCALLAALGVAFLGLSTSSAMEIRSAEEELRHLDVARTLPRRIPGAEFRTAVFTYEDPDGTGLGDAVGALAARHILIRSGVSSIGVIHYEGSIGPGKNDRLSYFDKVEKLTAAQKVSLAVWGVIRHLGKEIVIDTYAQIPEPSLAEHFTWELKLPSGTGGRTLRARLRPDRIHVQRLRVPAEARAQIADAGAAHDMLRRSPAAGADVVGRLPRDEIFFIKDRSGDWALLKTRSGLEGWVPVESHCVGGCRPLLDASGFAGRLLAYMSNRERMPEATEALTADALAIEEQLRALNALSSGITSQVTDDAFQIAQRWTGPERWTGKDDRTGIDRGSGTPPGGAAFANIRALAKMTLELHKQVREAIEQNDNLSVSEAYESVALDREWVASVAYELAEASLYDPRNLDVLENLEVLFAYAGERDRAQLAKSLSDRFSNGQ